MRHMEVPKMILKRIALALALITGAALIGALFVAPSSAQGLDKGSTVLSFQLTHSDADFATPEGGSGFITAYDHSEWGGRGEIQHLVSENWAVAFGFGISTFKETDKPGVNADPSDPKFEYSQSSWNARFGLDRFVHLSPDFHLFVGPGLQYWSGKAKFEDGPAVIESEATKRIALNGRIGADIGLSESVSLKGHLGGFLGPASADDAGAKASWMASGQEGGFGIAFHF